MDDDDDVLKPPVLKAKRTVMQIPDDDDDDESSQANSLRDPFSPGQSDLQASGENDDDPNAETVMAEDVCFPFLFKLDPNMTIL